MKKIGIDVGGSHVTVCAMESSHTGNQPQTLIRKEINAKDNPTAIIADIGSCIIEAVGEEGTVDAVGIAFPGPFNYDKGVCEIMGVGGKFEQTFGVHIQQALKN